MDVLSVGKPLVGNLTSFAVRKLTLERNHMNVKNVGSSSVTSPNLIVHQKTHKIQTVRIH